MSTMKREDVLGVRLSPTERELIEQRAKDDGRTASALVRHIVLSQLRNEGAPAKAEGVLASPRP